MSTTLADWFGTPLGRYLLEREQAYFDQTVADIFGFYALQIGLPGRVFLAQSRRRPRWRGPPRNMGHGLLAGPAPPCSA